MPGRRSVLLWVFCLFSVQGFVAFAEDDEVALDTEVGSFRLGTRGTNILASNVLHVTAVHDAKVRGVTCFVSSVAAEGLTLASDPSDSSIACRQTGPLSREDLSKIDLTPKGEDIFEEMSGQNF